MPYLIGVDEAGYGPRLGPLVICATVWQVPNDPRDTDLYSALYDGISNAADRNDDRVAVADSKALYRNRRGLDVLERGVLAAAAQLRPVPDSWRALWGQLAADATCELAELPWYREYDAEAPVAVDAESLTAAIDIWRRASASADVRLVGLQARVLFPRAFNEGVARHGSKGAVLTEATLQLVREMLEPLPSQPTAVVCDKHGGRNRYAAPVQEAFSDRLLDVLGEGAEESRYRCALGERAIEVRFCVRAERHLQVALASMTAKYLRELAMMAFNAYWCRQVPELRPTAGYPVDSLRFKSQIAELQSTLGIDDHVLWRGR